VGQVLDWLDSKPLLAQERGCALLTEIAGLGELR
jgi:hypothetical protein